MSERIYWLSFAGDKGNLGVSIVSVTDEDMSKVREERPGHDVESLWTIAVVKRAWALGCNPGGEVMSVMLEREDMPPGVEAMINRALTAEEIALWGVKRELEDDDVSTEH